MAENIARDQSNTPVIAGVSTLDEATPIEPYVDRTTRELHVKSTSGVTPHYIIYKAVDSGDANITYVGFADPGTATSVSSWKILRKDDTSGTNILYADGNTNFDNEWDEREALTYS
jgi:prepilin-type processing-associated H-X9-DG protein